MIYYAITMKSNGYTRYAKENDFENVYDKVFFITDDRETAEDAASWCELNCVGDIYEHDLFTIEIIED